MPLVRAALCNGVSPMSPIAFNVRTASYEHFSVVKRSSFDKRKWSIVPPKAPA
jgi:hypothetical protein